MKKLIETQNAPKAIGPYSQGVEANGTVYVSGQLPIDPITMKLCEGEIKTQTLCSLRNIQAILEAAGYRKEDIVKCTVYMKNMDSFPDMNEAYQTFFGTHKPARVTVEVSRLPKDAPIEIDAIAVK